MIPNIIHLAKDLSGYVWGFDKEPFIEGGRWCARYGGDCWSSKELLNDFNIDIEKFNIQHEKPLKVKMYWKVLK